VNSHLLYVLPIVLFITSGKVIRIIILLYCVISIYDITLLAVKLSWHFYVALLSSLTLGSRKDCCGLASAGNKAAHGRSHSSLPGATGRRIRRKRQKLVGWDKDNLTEQQRDKEATAIIMIKRIYRVKFSHHLMLSLFPISKLSFAGQVPYLNTEHDVTWC